MVPFKYAWRNIFTKHNIFGFILIAICVIIDCFTYFGNIPYPANVALFYVPTGLIVLIVIAVLPIGDKEVVKNTLGGDYNIAADVRIDNTKVRASITSKLNDCRGYTELIAQAEYEVLRRYRQLYKEGAIFVTNVIVTKKDNE